MTRKPFNKLLREEYIASGFCNSKIPIDKSLNINHVVPSNDSGCDSTAPLAFAGYTRWLETQVIKLTDDRDLELKEEAQVYIEELFEGLGTMRTPEHKCPRCVKTCKRPSVVLICKNFIPESIL